MDVDAFLYKLILNINLPSINTYTKLASYVFLSSERFVSVRSYPMSGFAYETFKLNNIQKRLYSSGSKLSKCTPPLIDPWFVTGFTDVFKFLGIKQFSTKRSTTNNNLSLVVWGTNLTSSVGMGRITKQESNMIRFPYYQKSVIIGLLLSDGWLTYASKTHKNVRLGFKQSLNRASYVLFVFNLLSHYCSNSPSITTGTRAGKPFSGLQFFTRSLPCFTELYSLFYLQNVKIIPENIYDLLTPVALAHLIMGDGKESRHGLILCTDSYIIQDIVKLINVLNIRYRLVCTLRYHTPTQPRIYISERSMPLLRTVPHFTKNLRLYSSLATSESQINLNPYWVTGFIDGEGSFIVILEENLKYKLDWRVGAIFSINIHKKDRAILELIKSFFGGIGKISNHSENSLQYRVVSNNDLISVIIPHFDKFPLITHKRADFELWKMVVEMMSRKEHLTFEGLQQIVNFKASINLGLSNELKKAFPNTMPVPRPLVVNQIIKDPTPSELDLPWRVDPYWLAGFTTAEGCFLISVFESNKVQIKLRFTITQHSRDEKLLRSLVSYLECGRYVLRKNKDYGDFIVTKFNDINMKIICFFKKYPILGVKALDFGDWCNAADIMKNKEHLTVAGFNEIKLIKSKMNSNRQKFIDSNLGKRFMSTTRNVQGVRRSKN